jgi:hypothetical protein
VTVSGGALQEFLEWQEVGRIEGRIEMTGIVPRIAKRRSVFFAGWISAIVLAAIPTLSRALEFTDAPSTCTTANCQAIVINGTIFRFGGNVFPWVAQTLAVKDQCLRIDILAQTEGRNLETVVTAPNGAIYRNDNRNIAPCTACPLVKIRTPATGWYTISVSDAAGRPWQADFGMRIGRYNLSNPNCATPTPAL